VSLSFAPGTSAVGERVGIRRLHGEHSVARDRLITSAGVGDASHWVVYSLSQMQASLCQEGSRLAQIRVSCSVCHAGSH
jgi:hypothetical protein